MTRAALPPGTAVQLEARGSFLDGTVVNVALKTIGEQLPASIVTVFEGQNYIQSGYLAVLAALLILLAEIGLMN